MAAPPLEIKGKSYPLTIFSAVPVYYRWLLKILLTVFRRFPLTFVKQIMFIHFACWQPVNRNAWPRLSDKQPKEELKDDYFLFTTNFNGPWDQYIDAFGLIHKVQKGLDWIWFTSRGFPGAWPLRPFKRYIHYYEYPLDLYYNAYPGMSVRDILLASDLSKKLDAFIEESEGFGTAEEFDEEFEHFLDHVAGHLGYTGGCGESHEIPSAKNARPLEARL